MKKIKKRPGMAYAFVFTKNWILMMKTKSLFVNGPFRTLLSLFLPFQMLTVKMFTKNDWIWTADPCFWKLPLCQLSRNLCSPKKSFVNVNLFRLIFLCKLKAEMYLVRPEFGQFGKIIKKIGPLLGFIQDLSKIWTFFGNSFYGYF